jgi:hypothetical protein
LLVDDCGFWQEVTLQLRAKPQLKYRWSRDDLAVDNELLVTAVLKVANREIFVESTKTLSRFRSLTNTQSLDVYGVHIVRDGRAVAFSHQRKATRRKRPRHGRELMTGDLMEPIKRWHQGNERLAKEVSQHPQRWITVRYEDLVREPAEQVSRVLNLVGEQFEPDQLQFHLHEHHILNGNRMGRAPTGRIVPDVEFIELIDDITWDRLTVAAGDVLKAFGYPTTKSAASEMIRRPRS